ncbi:MAG: NADH:flavin oxidoreductase [Bacteroidota bacterium]
MPNAYSPITLRALQLRNRFVKTATYEGMCDNGRPTQKLIDFHARVAKGQIGLTTVAYGAVNPTGRTHQDQMYMHEGVIPDLKKLTIAVHNNGGKASIQLTHCGFFTKNTSVPGKRPLAPSKVFNEYGALSGIVFSKAMTLKDLEQTSNDFANAASIAQKAGFDAVEIHMGHGYLLSQFLSPKINKRKDNYGGSLENRLRFPLEVIAKVRQTVGEGFPIICKINLSDDFKGGLVLEEAVQVAINLEKAGVDALVMSGGYTSKTPFYLLRGEVPLKGMMSVEPQLTQKLAVALFGPFIIKKYPFTENFFLQQAKQIRAAVKMPLIYLGGVVSKQGIEDIMSAGFDMIAIGRALIHDPDFILNIQSGKTKISPCNHCNQCIVEMDKNGVRCVLNH